MKHSWGRPGNAALVAVCVAAGVLALGWFVLKAYEWRFEPGFIDPGTARFSGPGKLNAQFIRFLGNMYDSRGQRLALRLQVLVLALALLTTPLLKTHAVVFNRRAWRGAAYLTVSLVLSAGYLSCLVRSGVPLQAAITGDMGRVLMACACAWMVRLVRRGSLNRLCGLLVLVLVAAAEMPGLVTDVDLSGNSRMTIFFIEHHLSSVVGQAERLAAGHPLLDMVKPAYGFLLPFALAVFQRDVRPLTAGEVIQVLQALQLLYLVVCVAVLHRQARGLWSLCLLGMFLVTPWYVFNNKALLFPNQSAWRTLGFPLVLWVIPWAYRKPLAASSFALGCLAGGLLLWNVEAGIASAAGLISVQWFRTGFFERRLRTRDALGLAAFLPGVATACLLFFGTWRLFLGYWADPRVAREVFQRLAFWSSSGFGGMRYPGHLMPVALLGWSAFVLAYAALSPAGRRSPLNGVRIGAAVIALVWLANYANRPDFWNLSGFGLLYAIPAIDAARVLANGVRIRWWRDPATLLALAMTGVVTFRSVSETYTYNRIISYNNFCAKRMLAAFAPRLARKSMSAESSGLVLDRDLASEIETKARALTRLSRGRPVIYLTLHSYLIPKASGVSSQIPVGDIVGETMTESDYRRLLNAIQASGAAEIYVDPLGAHPQERELRAFAATYGYLLSDLRDLYRPDRVVDGWEVWVRNVQDTIKNSRGTMTDD